MYKPLSGLMLVLGVVFAVIGGIGVVTPARELNVINSEAASRGAILLLLTGIATIVALFLIDKFRPRTSYLVILALCSLVLALASAASLLEGLPM